MKIRVYEDGNEVNTLTEHLTNIFNESEWDENERKIFGTDEMFDVDDFYQYELMKDGTIRKNYYKSDGIELDCIDYDNPERTEATDLTWEEIK